MRLQKIRAEKLKKIQGTKQSVNNAETDLPAKEKKSMIEEESEESEEDEKIGD